MESSFILLKPEALKRRLTGKIISRFEDCGYHILIMKTVQPTEKVVGKHYAEHVNKSFYKLVLDNFLGGKVLCMVVYGKNAVANCRKIVGATNPLDAQPGTVRGDFAVETGRNLIHASDSLESAKREIGIWFTEEEIKEELPFDKDVIYE